MANTIKKGESLFIPFKNGESIYDSQLKPRIYKTKEQFDRFSYHFKDAEMVEYAEVVRCKDCKYYKKNQYDPEGSMWCKCWCDWLPTEPDDFCSYGEKREV
jgi:hypothetical protein